MSNFYSNKSNATRAAKAFAKANSVDVATLTVSQVLDGTWTFAAEAQAPAPLARPYRVVRRNPVREAARATAKAAALEAAAQAAVAAAAKAGVPADADAAAAKAGVPAGETPRHKEFAVYGRSSLLSPVAFVHSFLNQHGKELSRKDALFQLSQKGVNNHTARTQYQRWFAANK